MKTPPPVIRRQETPLPFDRYEDPLDRKIDELLPLLTFLKGPEELYVPMRSGW